MRYSFIHKSLALLTMLTLTSVGPTAFAQDSNWPSSVVRCSGPWSSAPSSQYPVEIVDANGRKAEVAVPWTASSSARCDALQRGAAEVGVETARLRPDTVLLRGAVRRVDTGAHGTNYLVPSVCIRLGDINLSTLPAPQLSDFTPLEVGQFFGADWQQPENSVPLTIHFISSGDATLALGVWNGECVLALRRFSTPDLWDTVQRVRSHRSS